MVLLSARSMASFLCPLEYLNDTIQVLFTPGLLGIKREEGVLRPHKPPRMEWNFSSSCVPLPELQSCVQLLQLKQTNKTPKFIKD